MGTENDIDRLFKDGLSDPEIPFNEGDWEKLSHRLDKKKSRIVPFWIFTAGGIAAAVLIFLLWFFSVPPTIKKKGAKPPVMANADTLSNDRQIRSGKDITTNADEDRSHPELTFRKPNTEVAQLQAKPLQLPAVGSSDLRVDMPVLEEFRPLRQLTTDIPSSKRVEVPLLISPFATPPVKTSSGLALTEPRESDSAVLARKANALAQSKDPLEKLGRKNKDIERDVKKKMEDALAKENSLILSAMAAPDITYGQSNKDTKISSNLGMLATYALGSKFSVTSGAIYAKKLYNSGGTTAQAAYPTGPATEWDVYADCRVLDIPVNVNYKLLNKKNLSVSVNTGLSSYFMLKEKYTYTSYQPGQAEQVSTQEFTNQNKHLFGIANVSLSFDHKVSQSLSIGVQPFAKLPLTGIGNNDVSLKSAGVSFSINIGLFPSKKPGKYAATGFARRL